MNRFWKHLGLCAVWLLLSEILSLILAVSMAILRQNIVIRALALLCGVLAHILLTGSCAQKAAKEDAAAYRGGETRISPMKILGISLCAMIPSYVTYLLLLANRESILMLNLFPLLNAPFLQFYRLMIADTEPFLAVAAGRKICMALPPLVTAAAWFAGYYLTYIPALAKSDAAKSNRG